MSTNHTRRQPHPKRRRKGGAQASETDTSVESSPCEKTPTPINESVWPQHATVKQASVGKHSDEASDDTTETQEAEDETFCEIASHESESDDEDVMLELLLRYEQAVDNKPLFRVAGILTQKSVPPGYDNIRDYIVQHVRVGQDYKDLISSVKEHARTSLLGDWLQLDHWDEYVEESGGGAYSADSVIEYALKKVKCTQPIAIELTRGTVNKKEFALLVCQQMKHELLR